MFIPIIFALLPQLIRLAEESIYNPSEKTGAIKKQFVMSFVEKTYDDFQQRGIIPKWMTKDVTLAIVSLLIDHIVPIILKETHHVSVSNSSLQK